jgi:hypothetical protein
MVQQARVRAHPAQSLIVEACVTIVVILAVAVVLWVRSTPDVPLGVDTFGSAVVEIGLFGGPSFAAYLALGWTRSEGGGWRCQRQPGPVLENGLPRTANGIPRKDRRSVTPQARTLTVG